MFASTIVRVRRVLLSTTRRVTWSRVPTTIFADRTGSGRPRALQRSVVAVLLLPLAISVSSCTEDRVTAPEPETPPTSSGPNLSPTATLYLPEPADRTILLGESMVFYGVGTDKEDGLIRDDRVRWISNQDGVLGTGSRVTIRDLSAGFHIVTLEVTDSRGATGASQIIVAVDGPIEGRAYVDRPDDVVGSLVHIIYAVTCTSQGEWDLEDRLSASFWRLQKFAFENAGAGWRIDTYEDGKPDITFVRICGEWDDNGGLLDTVASSYYERSPGEKLLAVYTSIPLITYRGFGRPGIGLVSTSTEQLDTAPDGRFASVDRVMLHEMLHGIGILHVCVTGDLMWGQPECAPVGGGSEWDVGDSYTRVFLTSHFTSPSAPIGPALEP